MAKMSITFDGFNELAEMIDKANLDLKSAVNEALEETADIAKATLIPAAAIYDRKGLKGYAKGKMYRSMLRDKPISWEGSVATVRTGFSAERSKAGFMHSIFVMYGTPRMAKDPKIYNAIKGTKVRKEIAQKQEEIMVKHLKFGGK